MVLTQLSDESLDLATLTLVRNEREVLLQILKHLQEVERRRLFSKFGMSSLFDYAIKRLGYSEDQAARRISAMRLLKDVPKIEEKIESGTLTLTHLSKAQTLFRQERKAQRPRSIEQKLQLLQKIEHTSKRETEKLLASESNIAPIELSAKHDIQMDQFSPELQTKLQKLLALQARKHPDMKLHELIERLADLALEKWDPLQKAERTLTRKLDAPVPAPVRVKHERARYVPAAVRHAVFLRDAGKCKSCGTSRFVELDHVTPFALGGENSVENLRLLCRACNQRHAIETYGARKMSSFLRAPSAAYGCDPVQSAKIISKHGLSGPQRFGSSSNFKNPKAS